MIAKKAKPRPAGAVDPTLFYTFPEFMRVAGIGYTTIRKAKAKGVDLPLQKVGRRKYLRGSDGVEFLEKLASA